MKVYWSDHYTLPLEYAGLLVLVPAVDIKGTEILDFSIRHDSVLPQVPGHNLHEEDRRGWELRHPLSLLMDGDTYSTMFYDTSIEDTISLLTRLHPPLVVVDKLYEVVVNDIGEGSITESSFEHSVCNPAVLSKTIESFEVLEGGYYSVFFTKDLFEKVTTLLESKNHRIVDWGPFEV